MNLEAFMTAETGLSSTAMRSWTDLRGSMEFNHSLSKSNCRGKILLGGANITECDQVSRFATVVIYQGVIEDVSVFDDMIAAASWVNELRNLYGWEDTSESVIWNI